MRPLKLAAALAAAVLFLAGIAYASTQFTQTATITLTAKKAGKPTGFKASLHAADPGALQPQGLKTLTITFPAKTSFHFKSKAIKRCRASDVELVATKGGACPAQSRIGTGSAVANGAPVLPVIPENVTAFAANGQIIVVLTPKGPAGQVLVLHAVVRANRLTAQVPVVNSGGLNIVITDLELTVRTLGHGRGAFVTAGRCAKGRFTVTSHFLYQTGATLTLTSSSACSR